MLGDFAGASDSKGSAYKAVSIPAPGKSPEEENSCPFPFSCLENPMDRGAWQATVHGVSKSQTRQIQMQQD